MATETSTRDHVSRLLEWEEAHVGFDSAVAGVPAHMRGTRPPGLPHSIWELVGALAPTEPFTAPATPIQ